MKFLTIFLFLVALIFAALAEIPLEEGVLVLGQDNFEEAISSNQNILVEFYAPWCGHCKSLAPEYAKAAKALENTPNVKLAKVDATVHNDLAKTFGIKGFPTLKFFKNGNPSDYNGGRTESEIVAWLNKKTGPAATVVNTQAELESLKENNEVFAFGVFSSLDSEAAARFVSAAEKDESHIYAYTSDAAVRSAVGVEGDAVIVFKTFDELRADLAVGAETSADEISAFVLGNSTPLVQEFTPESSKKIFSSKVMNHILFFTDKSSASHADILANYREVASAFKGKALVVNVPSTEKKILEFFDISVSSLPVMVLADLAAPSGIKKYRYEGDHSVESVNEFVSDFFSGSLKPFLKSEAVEPEDTTGDVVVLRGSSFADLVLNNDKDVLVKFYAPWCGHCKKLAPVWEELGKQLKSQTDKIIVAKMDSTANEVDVPGVAVQGYPTIYFFKGDKKSEPVKYEEGRSLDDFIQFLEKNAHNSFEHEEL
eukprot:gene2954-3222_t